MLALIPPLGTFVLIVQVQPTISCFVAFLVAFIAVSLESLLFSIFAMAAVVVVLSVATSRSQFIIFFTLIGLFANSSTVCVHHSSQMGQLEVSSLLGLLSS